MTTRKTIAWESWNAKIEEHQLEAVELEAPDQSYTEKEVLGNKEMRVTVDLVKEQLESKKYWSLFVSPEGEVEYVVSDEMDKIYLDGLNSLLEMKSVVGGIILRGNNG